MASATATNSVQSLVQTYVTKRDQFLNAGGDQFITDRQVLRAAYCTTNISKDTLNTWIGTLTNTSVKGEFTRRFQEWDNKIEKGFISKSDPATLSELDFAEKVDSFYKQYQELLQGEYFDGFTDAKTALREALLPELKSTSAEKVISAHNITDKDIIYRMEKEWSWKA